MRQWLRSIDWVAINTCALVLTIALWAISSFPLSDLSNQPSAHKPYAETEGHYPWWSTATFWEAVFTGAIAFYAVRQYGESRKSAERQLRAYVSVFDIVLDCPNIGNAAYDTPDPIPPNFVPQDAVKVAIRNDGQTPAHETAVFLNWYPIAPFANLPTGIVLPNHITDADIATSSRQILDRDRSFSHTIWIRGSLQVFRNALAGTVRLVFYGWIEYTDIFGNKWVRKFRFI